jgi:hypothetical protein
MTPPPVASALADLGYRVESLGGGNEAYVLRLCGRRADDDPAAVVTAAGDPSLPAPGETIAWVAYLAWDAGYPNVVAEIPSIARFVRARDHRRALEAWRDAQGYGAEDALRMNVTDADDVARRMSELGASDALFRAASVAWASGAVVMHDAGADGAFVGLFAHQLAHADLSREALWMGPGAWVAPLRGGR